MRTDDGRYRAELRAGTVAVGGRLFLSRREAMACNLPSIVSGPQAPGWHLRREKLADLWAVGAQLTTDIASTADLLNAPAAELGGASPVAIASASSAGFERAFDYLFDRYVKLSMERRQERLTGQNI